MTGGAGCGITDSMGNPLVQPYYQDITRLDNSYLRIKQNNLYGVFNIYEGKEVIAPLYDGIQQLYTYFKYKQHGKWGLFDNKENVIIKAKYDDIKILNDSHFTVYEGPKILDIFTVKNNNVWGVVSAQTGEETIRPMYDKIEFGKDRYLKVKHGGKWGAVTYEGKIVIPINKGPLEINREIKKLY